MPRLNAITNLKLLVEHFGALLEDSSHRWTSQERQTWNRLGAAVERVHELVLATEQRVSSRQRLSHTSRAKTRLSPATRARKGVTNASPIRRRGG